MDSLRGVRTPFRPLSGAASRIAFTASGAGESRVGPVIHLPALLEELNVSPQQAFREADIPLRLFRDPESRLPMESLARLLSVCASLAGRSDFGLMLGAGFTLDKFGTLGDLMRNSARVGDALRMLILHLHFLDRAAIPMMFSVDAKNVFLGYSLQHPTIAGIEQVQESAIAMAYKILRELCGPAWRPRLVQFSHRRPKNIACYRRMFGPGVRFDAELSGLSFAASWLEHRIAGADPDRFRWLNREIQRAEAGGQISFAEEVQCVLHRLLPGGSPYASSVAQLFGCSERTLRHKLRSEGVNIQHLLADTRFELARHLLANTGLPLSHIAAALCYADPAVFSRAFRGWAGMSPRQWRTCNRKH